MAGEVVSRGMLDHVNDPFLCEKRYLIATSISTQRTLSLPCSISSYN